MPFQLEIYQWLAPLIAIFSIIRTFRQYSQGKYSPRNTIIWIIFWIGVALLALMPDYITNNLANALGIRDHINAIIFLSLGLLFLMVFHLSAAVNRIENRLTELIRQLALQGVEAHPAPKRQIKKDISQTEEELIEETKNKSYSKK